MKRLFSTLLASIASLSSPTYAVSTNQQPAIVQKDDKTDLERLVDSVIQIESNGNPRAVGSYGEIGLGQLRLIRARELEKARPYLPRLGKTDEDAKSALFNPAVNRAYTRAALDDNIKISARMQPNNIELVVASYNAGPNAVETAAYQKALNELTGSQLVHDGSIGPRTEEVTRRFQISYNEAHPDRIKVDGKLGPETKAKIRRAYKERFSRDMPKGLVPQNGTTEFYVRKVLWNYNTRR